MTTLLVLAAIAQSAPAAAAPLSEVTSMPVARYIVPYTGKMGASQPPMEDTSKPIGTHRMNANQITVFADIKGAFGRPAPNTYSVVVANTTSQPFENTVIDGALHLYREAKDPSGVWRPIEYIQGSDCGVSYGDATLAPGRYWKFTAPLSQGKTRTQVRFRMQHGKESFYSNEFNDGIDPRMFNLRPELKGNQFIFVGGVAGG